MKRVEYSWTTTDGVPIFAQSWAPDGPARAAVALVHGVGEHSGRYPRLVERLTAAGYALSAFDQRGHGRSGGPRVHARSFETLMDDIDHHIANTRERFSGRPVFLYGHSMAGAEVLYYALRRSPRLAGVIASSPALAPGTPLSPLKIAGGRLLARILPTAVISMEIPWESLSRDAAVVEAAKKDPLFKEGISVRLGARLLDAGEWIRSQGRFPLPLLLMQGTDDRHVDPKATIAFGKRLSGDVTLKVWEGSRHELHNELDKDAVIDFVLDWLRRHD